MIPEKLEGCTVLDLGSGSGRDCFVLSKLVGESGQVIGLDMTDEMVLQTSETKDLNNVNQCINGIIEKCKSI